MNFIAARSSSSLVLGLLGALVLAGCMVLTSLSGLSDGVPDAGAGIDAATADAGIPADAADAADAAPARDATPDAGNAAAAKYRAVVQADKPIAYWRLGDKDGGTVLKNEVDDTYRALYAAGPDAPQLGVPGIFAGEDQTAALFGPTSTLVVDSDAGNGTFDFPGFAPYTFEAWVKPVEFAASGGDSIFRNMDYTATFTLNTGTILFFNSTATRSERWVGNNAWQYALNPSAPKTDLFRHVALTFDGSVGQLYVDGVKGSSGPAMGFDKVDGGMAVNSAPFTWGSFHGTMAELAVYDHALTGAQIVNHVLARGP